MSSRDPYQQSHRQHHESFWQDGPVTPRWALVVAGVIVLAGAVSAVAIYVTRQQSDSPAVAAASSSQATSKPLATEPSAPSQHHQTAPSHSLPPATRSTPHTASGFLPADAEGSFQSLSSTLPAQVGLAVQPLGGGPLREFGDLREGHAWSSIKVPILATLMREQGEALDAEEEAWASSAITASDNEAAASMFGRIEDAQGGLVGASGAVESVLHEAGATTTAVATAPPPPGAVSTYGQTVWSLGDAARFFAALGRCEVLGSGGTGYVESLMEGVIPEQRWGLGEAGFPAGWRVAMKGGWGPEASSGGSYLVRQSGIVQSDSGGIAVAMMAMDDSGSYPAGAADLTSVAQWLAGELHGLGPSFAACAS